MRVPDLRSPSGNTTSGCPASSTTRAALRALRSMVSRRTGNAPMVTSIHVVIGPLNKPLLAKYRSGRPADAPIIGVSRLDR